MTRYADHNRPVMAEISPRSDDSAQSSTAHSESRRSKVRTSVGTGALRINRRRRRETGTQTAVKPSAEPAGVSRPKANALAARSAQTRANQVGGDG